MKSILLIGLGRFGRHIAIKLHELRHQVMAVDWREECVEAALPYVTSAQIGDSKNEEFMASLGVRNFDVCIVAIGDDFQSSLETTSLLKDLGARFVVARAARDVHAKFLLRNGADEVVYPEKQLAAWTAIRYSSDHIFDYIELNADHAIGGGGAGSLGRPHRGRSGRAAQIWAECAGRETAGKDERKRGFGYDASA